MSRVCTLAAGQTVPVRGDVEANIAEHSRLVRAAADEGGQVLVFPELSLTGYEPELAGELAFTQADARLAPLRELAALHDMTLVVGAPVRLVTGLHIGAFAVAPDRTVTLYTKKHLGAGESAFFASGTRDPLLRLGERSAAVAICADANHASHPAQAASRGASVYLLSSLVTPEELQPKTAKLQGYAREHSLTVVFANHGGPCSGLDSGGCSAIWSPEGEVLANLEGLGSGLVIARESDAGWSAKTVMLGD